MIRSMSSVGGAEVSALALRHAQHKEFEYQQKQKLACLGGHTYVKVEHERDDEAPCAMPAPFKRSRLEHDHKVGEAAASLEQRTIDDLCTQVSSAARALGR